MKKFLRRLNPIDQVVLIILVGGFLFAGLYSFVPAWVAPRQASADTSCPADTSQGAYNQLGTDPTTGAPICHFVFSNACPYTEAVSADDPMCYKSQPQIPAAPTTTAPAITTTKNICGGN